MSLFTARERYRLMVGLRVLSVVLVLGAILADIHGSSDIVSAVLVAGAVACWTSGIRFRRAKSDAEAQAAPAQPRGRHSA